MIYLAGPYSHKDSEIRQKRFEALTKKAAELMLEGHVVFSPITHGHAVAERYELPTGFEWWRKQCFEILRHSSRMVVLRLEGYQDSIGVAAEIKLALSPNIPVDYVGI